VSGVWYLEELVPDGGVAALMLVERSAPVEEEAFVDVRTDRVERACDEQGRCWACGSVEHFTEDHEGGWADLDTLEALLGLVPLPSPDTVRGPV
jgi:hypothetical protein